MIWWKLAILSFALFLLTEARRNPNSPVQGAGRTGRRRRPVTTLDVLEEALGDPVTRDRDDSNCLEQPECEPVYMQKFPSHNGECNNRVDPTRGEVDRSLKRWLPADYADGEKEILTERYGHPLPNARDVSNTMSGATTKSGVHSHMVPFWGQFLVHDIALTLVFDEHDVDCDCYTPDEECTNIAIVPTDKQFPSIPRKTCFELRRSFPVANSDDCDVSVRQHLNEVSGFMDMGLIYGGSEEHLTALRVKDDESKKGELIEQTRRRSTFGPLLPQTNYHDIEVAASAMFCPPTVRRPPGGVPCFVSGEARTNENSVLMSQHTTWMRLHNSVVRKLKHVNGHWDSDTLLLNARAIITALHQQVTFKHFLPNLLGPTLMKRYGLNLLDNGYYYGYDSSFDSSVSNSFTTAAFRMGHSLISNEMSRPNNRWNGPEGDTITVSESLFNMGSILLERQSGGHNAFLRGVLNDSALQFDTSFSESLRNFLDARPKPLGAGPGPGAFGGDLLAINIQRGRDHGLPSYNKFREFCGLRLAKSFSGLSEEVSRENIDKFKRLYGYVGNIDLYIGGVSESPVEGGIIGPTFACLIAYQFRDLKKGDRFYHENGGGVQVFTPDQLAAIRKATFPGLLCESITDMKTVQPFPMKQVGPGNTRRPCPTYSTIDVSAWRETEPGRPRGTGPVPIKQDYEWTHWFPTSYNGNTYSNADTLNLLLVRRPNEVCSQVMNKETKVVHGNTLVRFQCLPGTIKYSDYPAVPSDRYYWTRWVNDHVIEDGPSDFERSRLGVCRHPHAFQAQTRNRIPAGETGDVFTDFGIYSGLVCEGKYQETGTCNDYRVRYLCRKNDAFH